MEIDFSKVVGTMYTIQGCRVS